MKELEAMGEPVGVYISVPFCKAKCTYCNFASGVFGAERMERYVDRLCAEIESARTASASGRHRAELPARVDTIFFGGGTPSLLSAAQMWRIFGALRSEFSVSPHAEVTLECAPGQLAEETLEEMLRQGMNRVSFGVQSFIDTEAAAVGRLHTRAMCLAEIERMRAAGVANINVDLIAGLPGQTAESWRESIGVAIESGVPHVSVYMLEVDEDSRLGREMLADGARYGADAAPSEDDTAEWYEAACEWLQAAGIAQYEISNFAREGLAGSNFRSRHNVKYWRREPYIGFGLDAHSMLRCGEDAVRWGNTSELEAYLGDGGSRVPGLNRLGSDANASPGMERIGKEQAFEEALFLGLRMNEGVSLESLRDKFGERLLREALAAIDDVEEAGLVERDGQRLRLTARGRMVSNEVFSRLLVAAV